MRCVLPIIILLKDNVQGKEKVVIEGVQEPILKDSNILLSINLSFNPHQLSKAKPSHASIHHYASPSMLLVHINILLIKTLSLLPLYLSVPIRAMEVELGLIWVHNMLPILHCPLLVLSCPPLPCSYMSSFKVKLLISSICSKPPPLQCTMDGWNRDHGE